MLKFATDLKGAHQYIDDQSLLTICGIKSTQVVDSSYRGRFFASRTGVWYVQFTDIEEVFILPKFANYTIQDIDQVKALWNPVLDRCQDQFIRLSIFTSMLFDQNQNGISSFQGIISVNATDISVSQIEISKHESPAHLITAGWLLEQFPKQPSRFISDLFVKANPTLSSIYKLPASRQTSTDRIYVEIEGVPWINLGLIADYFIQNGYSTRRLRAALGIPDIYGMSSRRKSVVDKMKTFKAALEQSLKKTSELEKELMDSVQRAASKRIERAALWDSQPRKAFEQAIESYLRFSTAAVGTLRDLTYKAFVSDFMSPAFQGRIITSNTSFYSAMHELLWGDATLADFLIEHGHRGFYEADFSSARFIDFSKQAWEVVFSQKRALPPKRTKSPFRARFNPKSSISVRENARQIILQEVLSLRSELSLHLKKLYGPDLEFWEYSVEQIRDLLSHSKSLFQLEKELELIIPAGRYEAGVYVHTASGKYLKPMSHFAKPLKIVEGKLKGVVWRVRSAGMHTLRPPEGENIILVVDALSSGWMPYIVMADAILVLHGSSLSSSSLLAREINIPMMVGHTITSQLKTGQLIEFDSIKGNISILEESPSLLA